MDLKIMHSAHSGKKSNHPEVIVYRRCDLNSNTKSIKKDNKMRFTCTQIDPLNNDSLYICSNDGMIYIARGNEGSLNNNSKISQASTKSALQKIETFATMQVGPVACILPVGSNQLWCASSERNEISIWDKNEGICLHVILDLPYKVIKLFQLKQGIVVAITQNGSRFHYDVKEGMSQFKCVEKVLNDLTPILAETVYLGVDKDGILHTIQKNVDSGSHNECIENMWGENIQSESTYKSTIKSTAPLSNSNNVIELKHSIQKLETDNKKIPQLNDRIKILENIIEEKSQQFTSMEILHARSQSDHSSYQKMTVQLDEESHKRSNIEQEYNLLKEHLDNVEAVMADLNIELSTKEIEIASLKSGLMEGSSISKVEMAKTKQSFLTQSVKYFTESHSLTSRILFELFYNNLSVLYGCMIRTSNLISDIDLLQNHSANKQEEIEHLEFHLAEEKAKNERKLGHISSMTRDVALRHHIKERKDVNPYQFTKSIPKNDENVMPDRSPSVKKTTTIDLLLF